MQLNLLPFIVEVLGNHPKIYKDIDKIYMDNRYEFYKAAKEHELYNHQIIREGSLLQEEYCKKVLGILLCTDKEEISLKLLDLIKKGFPYSYTYFNSHCEINLGKFAKAFTRKFGGPVDNNGIGIDHHAIILLFLAMNSDKKLIQDGDYNKFLNLLNMRWEHYNVENETRLSLKKASNEDLIAIKNLKKSIYKKYGKIRNFEDVIDGKFDQKGLEYISFLFDYENLSSISIFSDIKFTEKDIDEILYLYILSKENQKDIKNATKFLIAYMYVRYLIKAYKQIKNMYFENNKETMFVELEDLEKSLNSTTEKLFLAKKEINDLCEKLNALEKENNRLKIELELEKRNREELNSLREFLFNLDKKEVYIEEDVDFDFLKNYKSVLIGGHERWQQRMKELLPNFIFIHPSQKNFDTNILNGVDILFVYVNYLNHSIYYRVMSAIENNHIKVIYLNQQNENQLLKRIYQEIKHLEEI